IKRAHPIIKKAGYRDFLYGHGYNWFFPTSAKKVLFLYRNPLDFLISWYYFKHKNRLGDKALYTHPREVIDYALPHYMGMYNAMRGIPKISYEDLKRHTRTTFAFALGMLSVPIDHNKIDKAIEFSTLERVRKEEAKDDFPFPKLNITSRYRSGEIGEWKEYFNKTDKEYIEWVLNKNGIYLKEFQVSKE
ncbi:hypothetical protein LCGC14_2182800, partial [marine sediment metagenome]